jgi:hypothetical protein
VKVHKCQNLNNLKKRYLKYLTFLSLIQKVRKGRERTTSLKEKVENFIIEIIILPLLLFHQFQKKRITGI